MTFTTETTSDARTYHIHPHPDFRDVYIEDEPGHPSYCIFCMPDVEDTLATHFVQDDRGWMMPFCTAHYWQMKQS